MNADEVVEKILPIYATESAGGDIWNDCREACKKNLLEAIRSGVLVPRDEQSTKTPNPS